MSDTGPTPLPDPSMAEIANLEIEAKSFLREGVEGSKLLDDERANIVGPATLDLMKFFTGETYMRLTMALHPTLQWSGQAIWTQLVTY